MRLFPIISGPGRAFGAQAVAALALAVGVAGCGDNYRPTITPVGTNGPAAQPASYAVVVSSTGSPTSNGVVTIIDYSGDTIMTEATIGPGPSAFTIDEIGGEGYTLNSDGTLSNFDISISLQTRKVTFSSLSATSRIVNLLPPSSGLWATDLNGDVVDLFVGSPQAFQKAIPVASSGVAPTMPVFIAGAATPTGQREYVLNQNVADTAPMACSLTPANVGANGTATPIELNLGTADPVLALDPFAQSTGSSNAQCPVYAVPSSDQRRLFVLNRGSDTISVINMQNNTLDQCAPFTNQNGQLVTCHPILPLSLTAVNNLTADAAKPGAPAGIPTAPPNGTTGMGTIAGPVHAEYNAATEQLVVADFDGASISVIDVSLDQYGNDSPTFGTTYTIHVGNTATPNPASVTVLYDGSKAYTANQNDDSGNTGNGTVTVVNLSTHTVEKTIPVVGHPRTVVSTQNSDFAKVYVNSPDSPYITIIESTPTVTDQVDTTILVQGLPIDIRTTTQNGSGGNDDYTSRVPGYGQPCNRPGIPTPTGSQTLLQACQQQ